MPQLTASLQVYGGVASISLAACIYNAVGRQQEDCTLSAFDGQLCSPTGELTAEKCIHCVCLNKLARKDAAEQVCLAATLAVQCLIVAKGFLLFLLLLTKGPPAWKQILSIHVSCPLTFSMDT